MLPAAIIGRLGTGPLGAVGLSTLLFMFSNLFFNFLTVVTTSAVANAAAEDDAEEVNLHVLPRLYWTLSLCLLGARASGKQVEITEFSGQLQSLWWEMNADIAVHCASDVCWLVLWGTFSGPFVHLLAASHDS